MTQLQIPFPVAGPASAAADAAMLVALLGVERRWMTSAELACALCWTDRRIRAAAEAADGKVLSGPGSPGYKLTRDATPAEMCVVATLESQARRMLARAVAIRRRWHRQPTEPR